MLKALTRRAQFTKVQKARHLSGNVKSRLNSLRAVMAKTPEKIDAYVVPSEDAHQSEYTADCDNRRAWISGFTGSAGCAVITQETASLFTDGRYFLQASKQLGDEWTLMKLGVPGVSTWQDYLVQQLKQGSQIGVDPEVITAGSVADLEKKLNSVGSKLVPVSNNLVDDVRGDERPARPSRDVKTHDFAGQSRASKIKQIQDFLRSKNSDGIVFTALDEIAWLLNLRGSDIHCCPIFFSYCIVTQDKTILYTNNKLPLNVLDKEGIQVREYERVMHDLQNEFHAQRFVIDENLTNFSIVKALEKNNTITYAPSPITLAKAIKNETELEGLRNCHERDAVALCKHFAWLSKALNKSTKIREYEAALHLEDMRRQQAMYVGMSFDTVAASGPNGAIIHYQPTAEASDIIDPQQIYLCDSGAHYLDGTTDVTRTYLFAGEANVFQRRAFTRVLQAHIALDTAIFPTGTTGYQLDPVARRPLWQDGLDYRHGTGHGVGAYLNVHEGPHGIGSRPQYQQIPLQPGMVVTNEPGYYKDGEFGIRTENVLVVRKVDTPYRFGDIDYLGFEHITFVPMGNTLVEPTILTESERAWVNKYHEECRKRLEPLLANDHETLSWVAQETEQL